MCAVIRVFLARAPAAAAAGRESLARGPRLALARNAASSRSRRTCSGDVTRGQCGWRARRHTRPRPDSAYVRSRRHAPSAPVAERRRDAPRQIPESGSTLSGRRFARRDCLRASVNGNFVFVQSKIVGTILGWMTRASR